MKKTLVVLLAALSVLAVTTTPGFAWNHWRGGVFIGGGPYWGYPYPYYYPPPYYVYPPPPVVIEQPPVYVEQPPAPQAAPAAPPAYWYYCPSARAYYPTAPSCPEEWVKVPERPR
jgi:hypothetical protein